ncbi:MAG TPA: SPOR domain-containing protein [Gammaproteobacteria bacterium]|nr:SPOR domain-containing protein [Gammaproteobacteria bacterium]
MPRDYKSRSRRSEPESEGPSAIVWLFVGILIGLIISGIFYLKGQHSTAPVKPEKHVVEAKHPPVKKPVDETQTQKQAPASSQNLQTQFDFYNVLSNKTQPKSAPAAAKPTQTTTTAPTTTAAASSSNYVVQIATMSKPSDADQLKAQLLLLGFDVNVTPVQKNGQTFQRVWLGPFTNKSDAVATQKQLTQNQITSSLLKTSS